jgi:hypothetical protein
MIDKNYLMELRQGSLNDLQVTLERVQQLRGAIAMIDALLLKIDKDKDDGS